MTVNTHTPYWSNGEDDSTGQSDDIQYEVPNGQSLEGAAHADADLEEVVSLHTSKTSSDEESVREQSPTVTEMEARAYQIEMIHRSLESNTIVAVRGSPCPVSLSDSGMMLTRLADGHGQWEN